MEGNCRAGKNLGKDVAPEEEEEEEEE